MPFLQGSQRICTSWCKTRQDESTHSGEDGGVAASPTRLWVSQRHHENCMKHPFGSNPNLSIPTAGGTLPIPEMQRVKRRAQSLLQLFLPNKKQRPAGLQERPLKLPSCRDTAAPLPLSWSPTPPNSPAGHPWEPLCPLPAPDNPDQPGPEPLSLVPITWGQAKSPRPCHGVSSKHKAAVTSVMSEHSSPSLEHLEGLKAQPVQRKGRIPTQQHAGALGCAAAPHQEGAKSFIAQRGTEVVPDAGVSGGRQGGGEKLSHDLWAVLRLSLLPGLGQFDDFCCKLEEQETYVKEETCIPLA